MWGMVAFLVSSRLEGNPTAEVWRELVEFNLGAGEAEDYLRCKKVINSSNITRPSSET